MNACSRPASRGVRPLIRRAQRADDSRVRVLLLIAVGLWLAPLLPAQDTVSSRVDWVRSKVTITIERPVPLAGPNRPAAVADTQAAILRDAPPLVAAELALIRYDTYRSIGEFVAAHPDRVGRLDETARTARPVTYSVSTDLRLARVTFEIDLHAQLAGRFVTHTRPARLPVHLGWVPSDAYTGVIIYAADRLPVHGTTSSRHIEPALAPNLHYIGSDGLIYRLTGHESFSAEVLRLAGPVEYSASVADAERSERAGNRPLRVLARGLFGEVPTDIVLGLSDAKLLLADESNRRLITDGRIVVVIAP